MNKKLVVALILVFVASRTAGASAPEIAPPASGTAATDLPSKSDEAALVRQQRAVPVPLGRTIPADGGDEAMCGMPGLMRYVAGAGAGGDPLSNLRDAHKDPQRCKLSICIPASINLDVVCELTTARDSEGRYNCRMVINDFLRNCTASCHTGDWSWLDSYRGPY
ncbi:MAG TPA: hypothetical protein VF800_22300 [Telluria sp.]|jgi:hypothetical protein